MIKYILIVWIILMIGILLIEGFKQPLNIISWKNNKEKEK